MKNQRCSDANSKFQRKRTGFALMPIVFLGLFGIAMMLALLPLIENVARNESLNRYNFEMRKAAEAGIDFALEKLNSDSAGGTITENKTYTLGPTSPFLSGFKDGQVEVNLRAVPTSNWGLVDYNAALLPRPTNDGADPQNTNWRIIESRASRGPFSRTIRVFAAPTYMADPDIAPVDTGVGATESYFKNALVANSDLTIHPNGSITGDPSSPVAQIRGTFTMQAPSTYIGDYSAKKTEFSENAAPVGSSKDPDPSTIPPIPTVDGTAPLVIPVNSGQSISLQGSYTTPSFATSVNSPIKLEGVNAVKIFITDNTVDLSNQPPAAMDIQTSVINNPNASLQIWYQGFREIRIKLDKPLKAQIYAPNAHIILTGDSTLTGAIVGNTIENSAKVVIDTELQKNIGANSTAGLLRRISPNFPGYRIASWQEVPGKL